MVHNNYYFIVRMAIIDRQGLLSLFFQGGVILCLAEINECHNLYNRKTQYLLGQVSIYPLPLAVYILWASKYCRIFRAIKMAVLHVVLRK